MKEFIKKLQENTTKQIDEKIYARLVKSLRSSGETYTESEQQQIDERCSNLRILFVNFDEYMFDLDSYKKFSHKKSRLKSKRNMLDEKMSSTIESALEQMYMEVHSPKEKTQVLSRMISLNNMLSDFDEEMKYLQKVIDNHEKRKEKVQEI